MNTNKKRKAILPQMNGMNEMNRNKNDRKIFFENPKVFFCLNPSHLSHSFVAKEIFCRLEPMAVLEAL